MARFLSAAKIRGKYAAKFQRGQRTGPSGPGGGHGRGPGHCHSSQAKVPEARPPARGLSSESVSGLARTGTPPPASPQASVPVPIESRLQRIPWFSAQLVYHLAEGQPQQEPCWTQGTGGSKCRRWQWFSATAPQDSPGGFKNNKGF